MRWLSIICNAGQRSKIDSELGKKGSFQIVDMTENDDDISTKKTSSMKKTENAPSD